MCSTVVFPLSHCHQQRFFGTLWSFQCLQNIKGWNFFNTVSYFYFREGYSLKGASQVALGVKNLSANEGDIRDAGLVPGSGRSPWRRKWQPTPVFLPGKCHGHRRLAGYSLQGHKELYMTEATQHAHTHSLKRKRSVGFLSLCPGLKVPYSCLHPGFWYLGPQVFRAPPCSYTGNSQTLFLSTFNLLEFKPNLQTSLLLHNSWLIATDAIGSETVLARPGQ